MHTRNVMNAGEDLFAYGKEKNKYNLFIFKLNKKTRIRQFVILLEDGWLESRLDEKREKNLPFKSDTFQLPVVRFQTLQLYKPYSKSIQYFVLQSLKFKPRRFPNYPSNFFSKIRY